MKRSVVPVASVLALAVTGFVGAQAPKADPPADKNPGHLKMALVNLKSVYSAGPNAESNKANIQANLKRHLYFIDELAGQGAEFIGFPELSLNGYSFSTDMTWLSLTGPEVKALQEKAVQKGVHVSAGLAEQDADG